MKAYQIVEWGAPLEEREVEVPQPKGAEVLVRVTACGICHSDIHIWDGYFDLGGGNRITLGDRGVGLPFTMGHEPVGEVAISLSSDPEDETLEHTIRIIGRVTHAIDRLGVGDVLSIRGPFGRGWPLALRGR